MKRNAFAVLVMLLLCLILPSCSKEDGGEDASIVIWHDKEDSVVAIIEERLASLAPGIDVTFEKKSSLTESLKLVGNDPKSAPDLYIFAHDKIGVYAEMGILSPITDFLTEEELAVFMPHTIKAGTYKDEIYQMPLYFETLLFMYNKKYMKEADIPKTTEELYDYMQRKTKYGHYGYVEQHSTPYYAAGWIHGFGTDLIDENGNPLLDTDEMVRALAYHGKFVELMPGETEYATVNTLFSEGMAHSTLNGPWFVSTVKDKGIDVGIAPMPIVDETGFPIAPYLGVQGIHVVKTNADKKHDAIVQVLKALMDPEIEISLALASGCAPAMEKCYEDERISTNEIVMAMRDTAMKSVPMPNVPEMDVMWSVTGNLLTDINMRGNDPRESCAKAQKKAIDLMEAMK